MRADRLNRPSWWKRALRSRLMIAASLLVVGFVGWTAARAVSDSRRADAQYADLQKQIAAVTAKNRDYADTIDRLGTAGFVEREARLKLGYQKPGEQVLMLKDAAQPPAPGDEDDGQAGLSNPQKWWRYFFGG